MVYAIHLSLYGVFDIIYTLFNVLCIYAFNFQLEIHLSLYNVFDITPYLMPYVFMPSIFS